MGWKHVAIIIFLIVIKYTMLDGTYVVCKIAGTPQFRTDGFCNIAGVQTFGVGAILAPPNIGS